MDTNKSKDEGFCLKCGRELIPISTGGYYCPYCGNQKGTTLKEARKVVKALNAKKGRDK